ncbi:MAG TPA: VWA domain-containing protein [Pirellulales bacterium]|nr:VWA domain-containing protein [Pirellulales bacterium]
MSQEERQDNAPSRQSPENEPGGDESSSGQSGDERALLTAYALGELDEAQRAEAEARLHESADERQAVDDLTRLGKLLRSVAANSSSAAVDSSPELRETVLARLTDPPQAPLPLRLPLRERLPRRRFWVPLSLAAALAVTCGALFALMKTKHGERVATRRTLSRSLAAGAEGGDTIADLTEFETIDAPMAGRFAKLNQESAEHETRDGKAAYFDSYMTSGGAMGRPPQGAESTPSKARASHASSDLGAAVDEATPGGLVTGLEGPSAGEPADFDSAEQKTPRLARDRSRYAAQGRGDQPGQMPKASFAFSPARRGREARGEQGGQQIPNDQTPRDRGAEDWGVRFEEELGSKMRSGRDAGEEQSQRHLQREHIAADGEVGEGIGREPLAQKQRAQEGGGKSGGGQRSGDGLNEEGQSSDAQHWFYRQPNAMAGGGLMGGRGLPETSQQGDTNSLLGYTGYEGILAANGESYPTLVETPFREPTEYPLSTFSIDVDTASYTNVRRFLNSRAMPPRDAVRVEELINYFQYSYPQPEGNVPFSITTDVADCPWQAQHRLLRVGLKGREIPADERPASNLVFLLDVSGSMDAPNKLPLVKEAMMLLVDKLTENDRVAIVVYAGNSGLVLPPTNGQNKEVIREAISRLVAGGSTNGGQGLQMAYDTAQANFIKGGTNRVILATDGDFNVGVVDQGDLVRLIEEKAGGGVFLSALGFGIGNLKDGTLEKLADKGNGNYAYIDTAGEARRVLVEQLSGTLVTIAKDVKLQIEFNPAQTAEYRLIGYEDRLMPEQDFDDDRKDAGEIGAGHSVTALYEMLPLAVSQADVQPLKYQRSDNTRGRNLTAAAATGELATIKLRYKDPDGEQSRLIEHAVTDRRPPGNEASQDMNFAAAVAAFGMLLRDSPYRGDASYQKVLSLAEQGLAGDASGYRSEFVQLVRQAKEISGKE